MMKIRNFAAVLSLCLVTFGTVQAQSYQTFGKWKKQEGACVAIDVNAPQEIAVETLYNLLHSEKLKGKKSKKELTFENITFPTLSLNYINLYVTSSAKSNEITTIQVFVNKGLNADFVSSSSDRDLVQNLMNYLNTKFLPAASQANLAYKMKVQQDKVNKSAKELKNLQKKLDSKLKQREKLNKEIEKLTQDIEKQKVVVEQQNADLTRIGESKSN